jgi:diketogulonate reductase-like aldo/keto reductase
MMQRREFATTKREVAVIGQGTWYDKRDDRKSAIAALRRGVDLGMTHIDTAEMYLSGEAEKWVREAILQRRDEVFLVSKVLPGNASRKGTLAACERSLSRLGTDRIDCYLLHWRSGDHPLRDTIDAFQHLQAEGKILSWGVSNFDVEDLEEARKLGGANAPVCDQVLYHLKERAVEHAVAPWCEKRHSALVAYSPFGHDDFPSPQTPGGRLLKQIAEENGATPRQVALRFLLRWSFSFVIPKSSDIDHASENAGAGDVELTAAQIERLDRAFPLGAAPRTLPML